MVTIRQIAEELGLSVSTVSRGLSDNEQIPRATRERVKEAARRLGYRRHAQAAALRTGHTKVLGVVVGSIDNPFFGRLAACVEAAARERGFRIMLANGGEDAEQQDLMLETLLEYRVDGLLLVPVARPSERILAQLRGVPCIAVDRSLEGAGIGSVVPDSREAARALAAHLAQRGSRRPLVISGPLSTSTGAGRAELLRAVLNDAGVGEPRVVHCPFASEPAFEAVAASFGGAAGPGEGAAAAAAVAAASFGADGASGDAAGAVSKAVDPFKTVADPGVGSGAVAGADQNPGAATGAEPGVDAATGAGSDAPSLPDGFERTGAREGIEAGFASDDPERPLLPFDAIICASMTQALGALRALRGLGIAVGTEVAFATFDEFEWFEAMSPGVTTIDTRIEVMAEKAVEALIRLVESEGSPSAISDGFERSAAQVEPGEGEAAVPEAGVRTERVASLLRLRESTGR